MWKKCKATVKKSGKYLLKFLYNMYINKKIPVYKNDKYCFREAPGYSSYKYVFMFYLAVKGYIMQHKS